MADDIQPIPTNSEAALAAINKNFEILMARINAVNKVISNLDVLRIQQVYNYRSETPSEDDNSETSSENNEIDITDFITTCWSKLSVYHGVYCNLSGDHYFMFNGEKVTNGDFLIKLPNNTFIKIPGSTPYYYQPTDYSASTGILTFSLYSTAPAATTTVTVPNWAQGSSVGRITHGSFTIPTSSILIPTAAQSCLTSGRYFINNEEIIFSTFTPSASGVLLQCSISEYYIPYYEAS